MKRKNGKLVGRLASPDYGTTMTFRRDGGIQSAIIKANDPKTLSLAYQRLKLPNLGSFYKQSKIALEKAFEGHFRSIFAELMRYNAIREMLPVGITKQQKAAGACVAMPYIITEGSLLPICFTSPTTTDLKLSGLTAINDDTTVGQFADAIIAANPGKYLYDDKIVFIGAVQYTENGMPKIASCYDAITLIKDSDELLKDLVDLNHFVILGGQYLGIRNFIGCYAFVHTRIDAGTGELQLSKQQMYDNNAVFIGTYTDPDHLRAAAISYDYKLDEAAVLEPTTEQSRRIMSAFGFSAHSGQSEPAAVANGIVYATFGDVTTTPGSGVCPVLSKEHNLVVTMRSSEDIGDMQVKVNGTSCSSAVKAAEGISIMLPDALVNQKLESVEINAELGLFKADFTSSAPSRR